MFFLNKRQARIPGSLRDSTELVDTISWSFNLSSLRDRESTMIGYVLCKIDSRQPAIWRFLRSGTNGFLTWVSVSSTKSRSLRLGDREYYGIRLSVALPSSDSRRPWAIEKVEKKQNIKKNPRISNWALRSACAPLCLSFCFPFPMHSKEKRKKRTSDSCRITQMNLPGSLSATLWDSVE